MYTHPLALNPDLWTLPINDVEVDVSVPGAWPVVELVHRGTGIFSGEGARHRKHIRGVASPLLCTAPGRFPCCDDGVLLLCILALG